MSASPGSKPSLPSPPLFFPPPARFVLSGDQGGKKKFYENSHTQLANFAKYDLLPWARLVNGVISPKTPNTNIHTRCFLLGKWRNFLTQKTELNALPS